MAESKGTPTAQKYPIRTINSGVAPSISGSTGTTGSGLVVLALVELVSGAMPPGPKMNGGLVIRTTPLIMKRVIMDLKEFRKLLELIDN